MSCNSVGALKDAPTGWSPSGTPSAQCVLAAMNSTQSTVKKANGDCRCIPPPSSDSTGPPSRNRECRLRSPTLGEPARAVGPRRRLAQVAYRNSRARVMPTYRSRRSSPRSQSGRGINPSSRAGMIVAFAVRPLALIRLIIRTPERSAKAMSRASGPICPKNRSNPWSDSATSSME